MFSTTSSRIGVAGAVAALSLGVAVPALAHDAPGDPHGTTGQHKQPTLAEAKAWAGSALDRESTFLAKAKAKVAADDSLTEAQKAAITAKIDKAMAAVATARTAVADATTVAAVKKAVESARPDLGGPWHGPAHPKETLTQQKADAAKRLDDLTTRLTDAKSKVAADTKLTDAQKAAITAKIDKALAAVAQAKTDAAAATTEQQLHAALAEAHVDFGGFHGRGGPGGRHRGPGDPGKADDHGARSGKTSGAPARSGATLTAAHPGAGATTHAVSVGSRGSHQSRHGSPGGSSHDGSPQGGGFGGRDGGSGHPGGGFGGHDGGGHGGGGVGGGHR